MNAMFIQASEKGKQIKDFGNSSNLVCGESDKS